MFINSSDATGSTGEDLTLLDPFPVLAKGKTPRGTSGVGLRYNVHGGVLSQALHNDGDTRTIDANLGDKSGYTAEDAPT